LRFNVEISMVSERDTPQTSTRELRSSAGLLALLALPRVGPQTALRAAITADPDAVGAGLTSAWRAQMNAAGEQIHRYTAAGVQLVSFFDECYPARLRLIHQPPPLLFVRGSLDAVNAPRAAAVIGTREPTSFGVSAAEDITRALAQASWIVVSGLAKGIDTLAHGAALKHHARTVAVMGGGLDRVYPAENGELAAAIVDQGGALVSEHPFGVRPRAGNLIARNRLQTGLSVALIVAQTGVRGGSMHTVRHAASQGRPVFAAQPHSAHRQSEGLNVLLKLPAKDLCGRVPAWKGASALCARLGDRPLAQPVVKGQLNGLLDALERTIHDTEPRPSAPRGLGVRARGPRQAAPTAKSASPGMESALALSFAD
jgi:DNA processing protein